VDWTGQKKKKVLRALRDATGLKKIARQAASREEAAGQKGCCATEKGAADRPARTGLHGQTCADRPVRDRFNRSTMPVQPVLTRMVLVKTG
jgi:hypothetical protein